MQKLKIDLTKLTGARKFTAKDGREHIAIPAVENNIYVAGKGAYMELTLLENRDGVDQYGNDGFASLDLGKERREAGEKGQIVGNWKHVGGYVKPQQATPKQQQTEPDNQDFDKIPF